ncbi:hypothetical protein [Ferrimonas marina]|uniref:Uncharacterized protein n=1 Tax=Ferrimonas marina TaxID=299255 RepID=A0A1M5X056_9GAMM|nr:hypothetical protein [Ferrimonas marina]SHH92824.1 hypothetical protein SAMN02745129_3100 [Ferrimonas marina]
MKAVIAVALMLGAAPVMANHYGGTNYYEKAMQAQAQQTQVLAQADSAEALQAQLADTSNMDINEMLEAAPTAAGPSAGGQVIEKEVVDKCYHSVQAVACTTKTVYQLVE